MGRKGKMHAMPMQTPKPYPGDHTSNRVGQKFTLYRTAIIPATAPPVQITECSLAFHAGAEAMFDIMNEVDMELGEDGAVVELRAIKNELWERARRYVEKGK